MRIPYKDAIFTAVTSAVGAGAGAAIYGTIGGVGIAATGTAIGITLGPFIAIGAGVGATGYGVYWLGKQVARRPPPPSGGGGGPITVTRV
jgi:hypothetical protein